MEGDFLLPATEKSWHGFQSTPSVWRETDEHDLQLFEEIFQSTPSVWRETCSTPPTNRDKMHFNPLPPCGGRRIRCLRPRGLHVISIHSLRVERDSTHADRQSGGFYFNPLPPCGGRLSVVFPALVWYNISIHSLRVEGDNFFRRVAEGLRISIHSLRVEGDH